MPPCSRDLSSPTRAPYSGAQSPNHWTTGEFLREGKLNEADITIIEQEENALKNEQNEN